MRRFTDPLHVTPDVIVESNAVGFDDIGSAVFSQLPVTLQYLMSQRHYAQLDFTRSDTTAPCIIDRRINGYDSVHAQGKWLPRRGGMLIVTTASNWGSQVGRRGHAVLGGHPVLHVLERDQLGRPTEVWVIRVVSAYVDVGDLVGEPVRIYFGASRADVSWDDDEAEVRVDFSTRAVEGTVPVPFANAPFK